MKKNRLRSSLLAGAAFATLLGFTAPASAGVTIERDEYGVPKIEATTDAEMWFAFGFAQARDRLLQLEVLRQEAYGILPTAADPTVPDPQRTRNWRRLHLFPGLRQNLEAQYNGLNVEKSASTYEALNCFAAGIEAYKRLAFSLGAKHSCNITPEDFGKIIENETKSSDQREEEFIGKIYTERRLPSPNNQDYRPWDAIDSLALFHLRVMHEFSLRNTEMKNLQLLNDLLNSHGDSSIAGRIFNTVKWSLNPNAKTTYPAGPYLSQAIHRETSANNHRLKAARKAFDYHEKLVGSIREQQEGSPRLLNGCAIHNIKGFHKSVSEATILAAGDMSKASFPRNASNWWVISQPQEREGPKHIPNSLIYNGPQITALDPSHTYQVALKSPNFRFAGNAYIGSLNFWQGHNGTMAFGLTAGNIDVADVFCVNVENRGTAEKPQWFHGSDPLNPVLGDPDDARTFFNVATENTRAFGKQLVNMFTYKDSGWPVLTVDETSDKKAGTAYIMRYNWQGLTASTLHNWLQATQARSHVDWNRHLDGVAANFNLSAAHNDGTIGYRLTGALPVKHGMTVEGEDATQWNYYPSYDPRLPAPLPPHKGWSDEVAFHKLQMAKRHGFIANWNQKPFINMPDTDLDFDAYTPYDRVFIIEKALRGKPDPWQLNEITEFNGFLQRLDVNYQAFRPFLEQLRNTNPSKELNLILKWDGMRGDYKGDDARSLHKGHVLFYHWLESMNATFRHAIAGGGEQRLFDSLNKGQMKLKQAKIDNRNTVETSDNIRLGSRIMLQALHAYFGEAFSMENVFPPYQYDGAQMDLAKRLPLKEVMLENLAAAKVIAERNEDWNALSDYLAAEAATYSGLSNTLAANDTHIGFRPENLRVRHFRNRGALNIAAALYQNRIDGKNVSSPGIREYRGQYADTPKTKKWGDWTQNQLKMFEANEYRPMHLLDDE